ncbi:kinase-like domain-containing protein [Ochromonadaceae sp. CCMP2298]|nr:kinase-like domain-containing protein [Ochromonadaceae sp. CCMP2298]
MRGVSRQVSDHTLLLKSFYGTPLYLSPELVENRPYNEKTDIWSLGVILYELCALSAPFKGNTLLAVARMADAALHKVDAGTAV